ncbi:alpha/beta hydrolase [Methylobacterium nodulans]|uniref:Putative esterase/lipase n=1 Tax=Methylobacterium nodulans (strain LMG 21967 / CNCM I-2342 / ORS 2060) TaxID=460265 RepID=B8IKJ7_METNO|nr:alpha/beta hydrolase [Methylobacterium nodulans]ACL56204.1 putative esterase/lipase [Methylobacterium nodulans ORS 2060]
MTREERERLDREYNARAGVPSFEAEYARYLAASARARAGLARIPDLAYDPVSGEVLDLYPAGPGSPLFLWIHGGYWRALSKDDNAFAALGLVPKGISVAVLNYGLAPAVSLDEIVRQTRTAAAWLHGNAGRFGLDGRRLHVGGSSAGGHLGGMLLAEGWPAAFGLPRDVVASALLLSGLMDLEPLIHTHINAWMKLDLATARRNSPLRLIPAQSDALLLASVGGLESAAFKEQTAAFADAWEAAGHPTRRIAMPGHHHFDIALSLSEPDGVLARAVAAAL